MMPSQPPARASYHSHLYDLVVDCEDELLDDAAERAGAFLGELIHGQVPQLPLTNCQRLGYHVCAALPELRSGASISRLATLGYEAIRRDGRAVRLAGSVAPTGRIAHTLRVAVRILSKVSVRLRIAQRRNTTTTAIGAVA